MSYLNACKYCLVFRQQYKISLNPDRLFYLFYGINFIPGIPTKGASNIGRNSMDVSGLGLSLSDQSWDYPSLQGKGRVRIRENFRRLPLRLSKQTPASAPSKVSHRLRLQFWRKWSGSMAAPALVLVEIMRQKKLCSTPWRRPLIMKIILTPAPALIAYPDDFRARHREKYLASTLHFFLSVTKWALLGTGTTFHEQVGPFRAGGDYL